MKNSSVGGTMSTVTSKPHLLALDANVFLGLLLPEAQKMGDENVSGAARILRAMKPKRIMAITTTMAMAEIRWTFARQGSGRFKIAKRTLLQAMSDRLTFVPVTVNLAVHAGELRAKYYTRRTDISYNDALYLVTALVHKADVLVSSDPHLLHVDEMPVVEPREFPADGDVTGWLTRLRTAWETRAGER